jgi:hypothetical protein
MGDVKVGRFTIAQWRRQALGSLPRRGEVVGMTLPMLLAEGLLAMCDHAADAEARGYAAGRAAERADVVAWLRKRAIDMRCAMTAGVALMSAAHHIECGERVSPRPSPTEEGA